MKTISCPRCGAETPNVPGFIVIEFCDRCGAALPQSELGKGQSAERIPDDERKEPIGILNAIGIVVLGGGLTGAIVGGLVFDLVGDAIGGAMVAETGRTVGFIFGGIVGCIAAITGARHNDEARR